VKEWILLDLFQPCPPGEMCEQSSFRFEPGTDIFLCNLRHRFEVQEGDLRLGDVTQP
jgi:hypothetical protein